MHDSVLQMSVYAASRRSGAPLSVTERSALPSSGAIETRTRASETWRVTISTQPSAFCRKFPTISAIAWRSFSSRKA